MAENIGALEIELGLKDGVSAPLGKVEKSISEINAEISRTQSLFSKLKTGIGGLAKEMTTANGKTISGIISPSEAKQATRSIDQMVDSMMRLNDLKRQQIDLGFGSDKIAQTTEQIRKLYATLESLQSKAGSPGKLVNHIVDNIGFEKFLSLGKESQAVVKAFQSETKEYMKYSNMANGAIQQIQTMSARAAAQLNASISKYGENDTRVTAMRQRIQDFQSLEAGWRTLITNAKQDGVFLESTFRNFYDQHRQMRNEMQRAGIAVAGRNADEQSFVRTAANYEKQQDALRRLVELEERLNIARTNTKTGSAQDNQITAQMQQIQRMREMLNSVDITRSNPFLGMNGGNLLNDFKSVAREAENTAKAIEQSFKRAEEARMRVTMQSQGQRTMTSGERNAFKEFYTAQEKAAVESARAQAQAAKESEKALDAQAANHLRVAKEVEGLQNKLKDLYTTSGKMRDAGLDTSRLTQQAAELRKIIDLYNLLDNKSATKRDFQLAGADKVQALNQYAKAMEAAQRQLDQFNAKNKIQAKRDSQIDFLERQIKSLSTTLREADEKKYSPNIDTSKLEAAKQEIQSVIATYQQMVQALQNGGALYSKRDLTAGKQDALNSLSVAQTQANAASKAATKAAREQEDAQKRAEEAARRNAQQIQQLADKYKQLQSAAHGANTTMGQLTNMLYQFAPVYGMQQLVMSVIQIGGEIEKQHIALRSIIGDLQDADELFGQIKGLALSSPFTFGELNRDVKQLAAFGVEADDLYDTTKRLADISSGLGVSFERLGLAYGQVKARSWLDGKELRQFAYAGVPLLQKLADMYTKQGDHAYTTGEVRQMVFKRQVSFEDVQQVLWDMTDKGGQFFNMQETLSQTLYGRYNKLVDAWEIMLSEFAKGDSVVGGTMKSILNFITEIILGFNKAAGVVMAFFATFAAKKVGGLIFNGLLGGRSLNNAISSKQILVQQASQKALLQGANALNDAERRILATKNQITIRDAIALKNAGAITRQEAERLVILQRTKSAYAQINANMMKGNIAGMFGNMGTAMKGTGALAMRGIGSLASGALGMMGGWAGVALTAGFVAYAKYQQRQTEVEQQTKAMEEGIRSRYERLTEFLDAHPLRLNLDEHEATNDLNELMKEYESQTGSVFANFDINDSVIDKLQKVREELEKINKAEPAAEQLSNAWADEMKKSAFNFWEDSIEENIEDLQKRYNELLKTPNDAVAKDVFSRDYNTLYEQLKEHLTELWELTKNANPGKSLEEQQQIFEVNLNSWIQTIEKKSPEMADALRLMAHDALRMNNWDTYGNIIAAKVEKMGGDAIKGFKQQIKDGMNIKDIAEGQGREAITAAIEAMKAEYPNKAADFQRLLDNSPFYVQVIAKLTTGTQTNDLTKTMTDRLMSKLGTGKPNYKDYLSTLEEQTQEGNFTALQKKAKADLDSAKKDFDLISQSIKKGQEKWTKEKLNKAKADYEKQKYLYYDIYGFTDDDKKKNGRGGTPRDRELDALKKRWEAIEKLIALYKKYRDLYGEIEATRRVTRKAEQEGITGIEDWSDEVGVRQYIADDAKKLIGKGLKEWQEARKATWQSKETNVETAQYDKEKRVVDALTKSYQEFTQQLKAQYDLRDSIRKKYGKNVASILADNAVTYTDTDGKSNINLGKDYERDLTERLKRRIAEVNERDNSTLTLDDVIDLKDDELTDLFGKDGDIIKIIKDLRQARMDIQKEAVNAVVGQLDSFEGEEAALERIKNELVDTLRIINNLKVKDGDKVDEEATKEVRDRASRIATINANRKIMEASEGYRTFNRAAWNMDDDTLIKERDRILQQITDEYENGIITFDKFLQATEQVKDVFDKITERKDVFTQFGTSYSQVRDYRSVLNEMGTSKTYTATNSARDRRLGLKEGQRYGREYFQSGETSAQDKLKKNTDALINSFQALNSILQPVADLFDKLGAKGLAGILGASNNALSSASSVAGSFDTLSKAAGKDSGLGSALSAAGPYGAAAAAAISVASDIIGDPDADREAMIQELQEGNKLLSNLSSMLSEAIQSLAGGVYSWGDKKADEAFSQLQELMKVQYEVEGSFLHDLFNGVETTTLRDHLSAQTLKQIGTAKHSKSYYDTQYALLMAQKDQAGMMLQLEQEKKDQDSTKIAEYSQELQKLQQQITNFAKTMAAELYSIDFTGYSESLASSLVDAWAAGTNSVKAYKDAVSEALRNVSQSVMQQKILGTWLDDNIDTWLDEFQRKNGVMDGRLFADLNNIFLGLQDRVSMANSFMDNWNDIAKIYGYDMKDSASSSLSSGIKGVTEDTADLLASYINAIRADVSLNRGYLQRLVEEVMPTMGASMNLSLAELRGIRSTLDAISSSIDRMDERMDDVVFGRRYLNVKINNVA